mgnify:FL=1
MSTNILALNRIAFKTLNRNRLRTRLAALGIAIGIGAVVTMVAIGEGATERSKRSGVGPSYRVDIKIVALHSPGYSAP